MAEIEQEIKLPASKAGRIVGKGGKTLKEITRQTGAKLDLSRDEVQGDGGLTRALKLRGSSNAIAMACELIDQIMNSSASLESFGVSNNSGQGQQQAFSPPLARFDQVHQLPPPVPFQPAPVIDFHTAKMQMEALLQMHPSLATLVPSMVPQSSLFQSPQMPYMLPPPLSQPMIPAIPNAKRKRVSNGEEEQAPSCIILVPISAVGGLIGKAGSGLKQLSAESGARLSVERDEVLGERMVTVVGNESAQMQCVQSICGILQPKAGETLNLKFLIPDTITGAIVGKKGVGLAAFKKDFGVGVELPREDYQGHRVLSVTGVVEGLQAASAHIIHTLGAPPLPR
ncbi:hypothetical protein CYMTET_43793 [Cymbomonas tetramitiformis]|uniref:K Homology domain-containing protein n=1 Tax=Cymbomonas tetramitiformis TaxID=36881 RepID=A0AAE0C2L1_9CHLO|nr:hypothetical protein CYMTET_43793 [Cymbomonas tetramitiformis]